MSNLSYVRFENTLADLRECRNALKDNNLSDLSPEEHRAAVKLIALCADIADEFGDNDSEDEEE